MYGIYANIWIHLGYINGKCYHIWHTWILWVIGITTLLEHPVLPICVPWLGVSFVAASALRRSGAKWREALAWLVRIDELQLPPGKAGDQGLNMSELYV